MIKAVLTRISTGDEGTFGELRLPNGYACSTVELPWRDNKKGLSCIPQGAYTFRTVLSPKHGACYQMDADDEAPNRDHIQIHAANWAGDATKGYRCELLGCISPGREIAEIEYAPGKKQKGVVASKATLRCLEEQLASQPFELQIVWAPGIKPEGA